MTKKQALDYCIAQISSTNKDFFDDEKEYKKYRTYKDRYNRGELKQKAIATLFERFGIEEVCTYRLRSTAKINTKV